MVPGEGGVHTEEEDLHLGEDLEEEDEGEGHRHQGDDLLQEDGGLPHLAGGAGQEDAGVGAEVLQGEEQTGLVLDPQPDVDGTPAPLPRTRHVKFYYWPHSVSLEILGFMLRMQY